MAGLDWARSRTQTTAPPTVLERLPNIDWEFAFTVALCLGAGTAVSNALENGGWSTDMPPLTMIVITGLLTATVLARTRLSMFLAWPLGIVAGAAMVFWQTLTLVGPGGVEARVNAIYTRFDAWFGVAFGSGVTNDQLPFNVLVLSLTWLGVFLFGWSVVRWHNAWIGLIPGGAVIFLDLVLVGDELTGTILIYLLLGFLLIMQTNLNANLKRWRSEGVEYPTFINLSFFHFSLWALIGLVVSAWVVPVGPYSTPAPVAAAIDGALERGADFVRLAGPLRSNKVIPIHSYSRTLTFDGSIKLGDRKLMAVTVTDPRLRGDMLLRGTVYDDYEGGGWRTGERAEIEVPQGASEQVAAAINEQLAESERRGTLVPLHIEMLAKTVAGTVIFTPGQPVGFDRSLIVDVPADAVSSTPAHPLANPYHSDEEIYTLTLDEEQIPVRVIRNSVDMPQSVEFVDLSSVAFSDTVEVDPGERIKRYRTYNVTGFVPNVSADDLRASDDEVTPFWIDATYTTLPVSVPQRVRDEAVRVVGDAETRYDRAAAVENFLRSSYQVDYKIDETPPGRDTVDYFLFDARRGYFNYHASAMVVMLRAVDVPARLAVGFAIQEEDIDPETGAYIVNDDNSYAWTEVYFPTYGWVPFNPSPDRPAVFETRERVAGGSMDDPLGLDPALRDQLPVNATEGFYIPPEVDSFPLQDGDRSIGILSEGESGYQPWLLVAVLGFAAAVAVAVTVGWNRSVMGLPYPQQVWEKTVRLASWGGFKPQPGQTPHEYISALGKLHRGMRDLDVLASAYTSSRFGKKELRETDRERLAEMWPVLRGALMSGILRRVARRSKRHD
ncbi:MAG TPA: transglutaminase domain-containing protein [Dehalococcoidia bacterium]|nr:transglutaminase domain-containing protein [Dehalococcoidia bacterium]